MNKNEKPSDEAMEMAAMIAMEWFDITPVAQALEAEYRRGLLEGQKASTEVLAVEYRRGADDYRDELLRNLDARRAPKEPPAKSIEETGRSGTPEPEKRTSEASAASEPTKCACGRVEGSGLSHKPECPLYEPLVPSLKPAVSAKAPGRPGSKGDRPDGIPSNLAMAIEAITALGPSAAPQIRKWLRDKYWPAMPDHWSANLYDFVSGKKLRREGINFALPIDPKIAADITRRESAPSKVAAPLAGQPQPHVLPKAPSRAPMPPVKPTAGPRPKPDVGVGFNHNNKSTVLASSREYVLAGKLRAAIGQHIGESFLAQTVLGSNTESTRDTVKSLCLGMNGRLAEVGLKVEFYAGFGLIMKEIDA